MNDPEGMTGLNVDMARAAARKDSLGGLFRLNAPKQPMPSSINVHDMMNNASRFAKFIKPFVVFEKRINKASAKLMNAQDAFSSLTHERDALLEKLLSE